MKFCKYCDTEKEDELFCGKSLRCKDCTKIEKSTYAQNNKDHIKEQKREYKKANKEKVSLSNKKYREAHREELREKSKQYNLLNKEAIKEKRKQYYKANKAEINESTKQYRKDNKDKINSQKREYNFLNKEKIAQQKKIYYIFNKDKISIRQKKYIKNNLEKYLYDNARRRARNKNLLFDISIDDIIIPKTCPYLQAESFIPSIDRIDNSIGYTKNNIIVVSNRANILKSNLSLAEISLINENYYSVIDDNVVEYDISSLLWKAKARAKIKNIEFAICKDDIPKANICPLLFVPLCRGEGVLVENSPSLDRIDNTKGYVPGNVRIISYKANRSKSDSTKDEYNLLTTNLTKIMQIYNVGGSNV